MIPWDDDGDVAIPTHDFTRFQQLCSTGVPGFRLERSRVCWKVFGTGLQGFLDVFPVERSTGRWQKVSPLARQLWPNCWFRESEVFPLCRIPVGYVEGQIVYMNGPQDPVPFLTRHYGATWQVPQYTHSHTVYGLKEHVFYPVAVVSSSVVLGIFTVLGL
jgi:hypothetical protein